MKMNVKSPFLSASLLMGLLPMFQASANEQTKNEVRQALLSIQAELNEMEGRKGKAPPVPKAPLAPPAEPDRAPEPFPLAQPTPEPEPPIDFPSEPQTGQVPVPAFLSRKQEVAQELQSVQEGLDQLNRQSGRFPAGQVSSANPSEVAPPETPVEPEPTPPSLPSEKDRLARELQSIQATLDEMNRDDDNLSDPLPPEPVVPPTPPPAPLAPREAPVVTSGGGLGVYLVPSVALVHSSGFDWTSVVGKTYEIDEENGFGAGLRVGRTWDPFFADFQLTYARSDLESNAFSAIPMSFSGDSEFFGFHFTGGGKVDLADRVKLPFGIGVGGGRQEISMALGGAPYSEDDFVLTYHLFAGLEYQPADHLLFGFRYRLINLGELPSYSSRNLQLFELSCGYQY